MLRFEVSDLRSEYRPHPQVLSEDVGPVSMIS